jgi:regulator of sigma E protease
VIAILVGALAVVGMFLLLVVPHELGHFGAAKAFGMRVHEFALGFGPKLISFTRGGTLYAWRAIPVVGFVRIGGMEPGEYDMEDGFHAKPGYQRLIVLFAGPVANFVMAALIITGISLAQVNSQPGKVAKVVSGGPAYSQGIRPGDVIQTVNGKAISDPQDINREENATHGATLLIGVKHADGTTAILTVTPKWDSTNKEYLIGIGAARVITPGQAVINGVTFPWTATTVIVGGIAQLATGQVPGGFFGPQGATGPVGIGELTLVAANQGILDYLALVAMFSMALGISNLLPIPPLDGGRILVVVAELLRRRPFDRERELAIQRAGLVGLLALMVLIAFFDVQRIASGAFPGLR